MRVLGLDYGSRRIGLAVSDVEASIAFPSGVLQRKGLREDLKTLSALIEEREVKCVVVGLPLHMDGRAGVEAEAARKFAAELSSAANVPVEMLDERWTTVQAQRTLRETGPTGSGRRAKKHRQNVDAVAATLILQTFLERRDAQARLAEATSSDEENDD